MNLDLLIKLVKLANNNPNENEANLAARKVCKMIAEGKYTFGNSVHKESPIRTHPNQPASNPSSSPFGWEGFRPSNAQREYYEQQRKRAYEDEQFRKSQRESTNNYYDNRAYWDMPKNEPPKKKQSINRTCSRCGLTTDTNNTKEVFVCSICQWNEYNEKNL